MTESEKIEYLEEHLHYDVIMLRWAFEQISIVERSLTRNAFIECFAVHARSLYEFFDSQRPNRRGDDVTADDFSPGYMPTRLKEEVSEIVTKLNKQIFHGTTARTADPKLKFNGIEGEKVLQWLEAALGDFAKGLPPSYPTDWLPAAPRRVRVIATPFGSSVPTQTFLGTTSTTTEVWGRHRRSES